jgi:hypothetical protein
MSFESEPLPPTQIYRRLGLSEDEYREISFAVIQALRTEPELKNGLRSKKAKSKLNSLTPLIVNSSLAVENIFARMSEEERDNVILKLAVRWKRNAKRAFTKRISSQQPLRTPLTQQPSLTTMLHGSMPTPTAGVQQPVTQQPVPTSVVRPASLPGSLPPTFLVCRANGITRHLATAQLQRPGLTAGTTEIDMLDFDLFIRTLESVAGFNKNLEGVFHWVMLGCGERASGHTKTQINSREELYAALIYDASRDVWVPKLLIEALLQEDAVGSHILDSFYNNLQQ